MCWFISESFESFDPEEQVLPIAFSAFEGHAWKTASEMKDIGEVPEKDVSARHNLSVYAYSFSVAIISTA